MNSKPPPIKRDAATRRLTSSRGEKISAVEGMVLTPRMRHVLEQTKDCPGEERRERIRAQFTTRDFKETVKDRVAKDPAFREALLKEALELMMSGEVDVGKLVLRDYEAVITFDEEADYSPEKTCPRRLQSRD